MKPDTLSTSIASHIEMINKIFLRALVIAGTLLISEAYPGLGDAGLKIAGIAVPRPQAHLLAAFGFTFANICVVLLITRIRDLLALVATDDLSESVSAIAIAASFFNPLSDYGSALRSRLNSSLGLALLLVQFWACFASIFLLAPRRGFPVPELVFLLSTLLVAYSVDACSGDLVRRFRSISMERADDLANLRVYRIAVAVVVLVAGSVANLFFQALYYDH